MKIIEGLLHSFNSIILDVVPIALIIFGFQAFVLRKPIPNLKNVLLGFAYVLTGLAFFLEGLELALFPLGKAMATQLTDPGFILEMKSAPSQLADRMHWTDYSWVYIFAFAIGFATTVAEPALLAIAIKAHEVSGGAISIWGLRSSVALGVAIGLVLGTWRIVTGYPIHWFIIAGYATVVVQTLFAPRMIIPLAYDSGGVTTSTVTVPLVAALGLGLASTIPGRSPMLDGFGLIAFASLFPMITVMAHAQIAQWRQRHKLSTQTEH